MVTFGIEMDALTLSRIHSMKQSELLFHGYLFIAMNDSLKALEAEAQGIMGDRFKNPTGKLEDAFDRWVTFPDPHTAQGILENPEAYAWRRERGFSGRTDSLGRFYPDDPGIYYMNDALARQQFAIWKRFQRAVKNTLAHLAGGP